MTPEEEEEVAQAADEDPAWDDLKILLSLLLKAPDEHARSEIQAQIDRLNRRGKVYDTFTT